MVEEDEEDSIEEVRWTHEAVLKPIAFPKELVELNKGVPELPKDIPVMVPPMCPAPPKNHK